MRKPPVYILTPSLMPHDAIGNDVRGMTAALREAGYKTEVYAEEIHRACLDQARPLASGGLRKWRNPRAILIYHHSMAWPKGEQILEAAFAKVIIRYHNITPARCFSRYSEAHYRACKDGEASTRRLARLGDAWFLGASGFNCRELVRLGAPETRTAALAPFHVIADLLQVPFDLPALNRLKEGATNILFVGGLKPNKGHLRALAVLDQYRRSTGLRARLIFAGQVDPRLSSYQLELAKETEAMRLAGQVVFTGMVTPSELRSLYTLADVFLSLSEHEGFCVPLVEAMFFRLPIVAWGAAAVGETVGRAGLVWDEYDVGCLSESIHAVAENPELGRRLATEGFRRYQDCYRLEILRERFLWAIERICRGELLK